MNRQKIFMTGIWIAVGAIVFTLLCLIGNGRGDDAESFRTYLLCSSIVLGFSLLSLAVLSKREDK